MKEDRTHGNAYRLFCSEMIFIISELLFFGTQAMALLVS